MATENILVKHKDKPNALTDWNNSLKTIWTNDSQRPSIYTTESTGHYWDGRNLVQEQR